MKPILFNTDMVRAILENRKTATRRVVKLKYSNTHLEMRTDKYGTRLIELQNEEPGVTTVRNPNGTTTHKLLAAIERTPPYRPGDILYVRETFFKYAGEYVYKASAAQPELWDGMWHPSIHMPREAARIFLQVTDVRVERLQEIDDAQAVAEGAEGEFCNCDGSEVFCSRCCNTGWLISPRSKFACIWDSTIKKADRSLYGWQANPWVWVIEFERCEKPEGD